MTDHKFTDDDAIEALECCSKDVPILNSCEGCPFAGKKCAAFLPQTALDLINRQKAEIKQGEQLYENMANKYHLAVAEREANVKGFAETLKTIKAEAIKEFAQRLKSDLGRIPQHQFTRSQVEWSINTFVKEMTEENK